MELTAYPNVFFLNYHQLRFWHNEDVTRGSVFIGFSHIWGNTEKHRGATEGHPETLLKGRTTFLILKTFFVVLFLLCSTPCDQSLPARPISTQKVQSRKEPHKPLHTWWISQRICLPCSIVIIYRINKPFLFSRYMICVSCTVHLNLAYCAMCTKDCRLFYHNYSQINQVGKSDNIDVSVKNKRTFWLSFCFRTTELNKWSLY